MSRVNVSLCSTVMMSGLCGRRCDRSKPGEVQSSSGCIGRAARAGFAEAGGGHSAPRAKASAARQRPASHDRRRAVRRRRRDGFVSFMFVIGVIAEAVAYMLLKSFWFHL